jgi:hypothetical protein
LLPTMRYGSVWRLAGCSSIAILYTMFATALLVFYVWNKGCDFMSLAFGFLGLYWLATCFLWRFWSLMASITPPWASSSDFLFIVGTVYWLVLIGDYRISAELIAAE